MNRIQNHPHSPCFLSLIALTAITAASLVGCRSGSENSSDTSPSAAYSNTSVRVGEKSLSAEQEQILTLVDIYRDSGIFSYASDDRIKEIHFFIEEFKDGTLTPLGSAGGPTAPDGDLALLLNPDSVSFTWDSGNYGGICTLDAELYPEEYNASLSSRLHQLSSVPYNEKTALMSLAQSSDGSLETISVADYEDLPALTEKRFDRVIFFTVAFTDFTTEGEIRAMETNTEQ